MSRSRAGVLYDARMPDPGPRQDRRVNRDRDRAILERVRQGETVTAIALSLGMSWQRVSQVVARAQREEREARWRHA